MPRQKHNIQGPRGTWPSFVSRRSASATRSTSGAEICAASDFSWTVKRSLLDHGTRAGFSGRGSIRRRDVMEEALLLARLRQICLNLPEVRETVKWGHPTFEAGK